MLRRLNQRAGNWKTYVIGSGDEIRVAPPPDQDGTASEIEMLRSLDSDPIVREQVKYWNAGAPSYRWIGVALNTLVVRHPGPPQPILRAMALLNVAMYDATIAAWNAKCIHNRPRPTEADSTLVTLLATPRSPSYPSDYAATAGAAAAVLTYLFPDDAQMFTELAEEAARSRLYARVEYPSDSDAGFDLGRTVGAKVIEYARKDGFDSPWTGVVPTGPGMWVGTNPLFPLAGSCKTWLLSSGSQFPPWSAANP